jgi:dienelactone hydrolase
MDSSRCNMSRVTKFEDLDPYEQQLAIERAQKRQRISRIVAVLATIATVSTTSWMYYTDAYQGNALDLHPCEPAEVEVLARDGWKLETVQVEGAALSGLVRPAAKPDSPWLLYFGANTDHALRTARAYIELLLGAESDYGAASFAYRGFDISTGQATPGTFQRDARAVFDHMQMHHQVEARQLHVVGFSLGANAAALLGHDLASTPYTLASTSLLSPGIAPHSLPPWLFPLVLGAWEMPSKLQVMRGPVLLVSATDDPNYPADIHARAMPPLLGERLVRHLEVEGGHDAPLRNEQSLTAIRELLGAPNPG